MSEIPRAVRRAVLERAGDACEHCGFTRPGGRYHLHHRLRRGPGEHTAVNIMVLIPEHHNVYPGSVHQEPARSYRLGHIVRAGQDPALIPVQLWVPEHSASLPHRFSPASDDELSCARCCLPASNARHLVDVAAAR